MPQTEPEIPHNLQPRPDDYGFDLNAALGNVVALRSEIPEEAFYAETLGTRRAGNGVVLPDGLVLTMGYLILEAETIWLSRPEGPPVAGHALAVDFETGFGLVQPFTGLGLPGLPFGDSAALEPGATALLAAAGGRSRTMEARIVARQEFAGYWEYLIEDAIFTAPAHPAWGGAALIDTAGRLVGIGSLSVEQSTGKGQRVDMNMVAPINLLTPILDELKQHGRLNRPARPWLGIYAIESGDHVVIGGVAPASPAERADLRPGDVITGVDGEEVADLAGLWRRIWSAGSAGARMRISLLRERERLEVTVTSADRRAFLHTPRLH